VSEHDFEPVRGLPGDLPPGEILLWQGAPDPLRLACAAFHVRAVAAYFGLMLAWRTVAGVTSGESLLKAVGLALSVTPLALLALGVLGFFGWLNSRTTVYTITNRRVVMRFGAALTKAINIPFGIIEGASLKAYADGSGDVALQLKAPNKIAFLQLWPHVRPWRLAAPEPTFRALADARGVVDLLAEAMKNHTPIELARGESPPRGAVSGGALQPPQALLA
jgi:hypothetical protein